MIWLRNSLKLIVSWKKLATSPCKEKKLFQLVGKANSNLVDVIIRLGFLTGMSRTLKYCTSYLGWFHLSYNIYEVKYFLWIKECVNPM